MNERPATLFERDPHIKLQSSCWISQFVKWVRMFLKLFHRGRFEVFMIRKLCDSTFNRNHQVHDSLKEVLWSCSGFSGSRHPKVRVPVLCLLFKGGWLRWGCQRIYGALGGTTHGYRPQVPSSGVASAR